MADERSDLLARLAVVPASLRQATAEQLRPIVEEMEEAHARAVRNGWLDQSDATIEAEEEAEAAIRATFPAVERP